MQRLTKIENKRKFILSWLLFLFVLVGAIYFRKITGWSKTGSVPVYTFEEAFVEVFLNLKYWFGCTMLSGLMAYLYTYRNK